MKKSAYNERSARTLLPILRSIMNELRERTQAIESLEDTVLSAADADSAGSPEALNAIAALATHKREARLAAEELARLGCRIDDDHPLRIRIPGETGEMNSGFVWDATREDLERTSALASSLSA